MNIFFFLKVSKYLLRKINITQIDLKKKIVVNFISQFTSQHVEMLLIKFASI